MEKYWIFLEKYCPTPLVNLGEGVWTTYIYLEINWNFPGNLGFPSAIVTDS
jgi:hypothetical protein